MPVPTETFWNIKKLNIVFAVTAVLLLGSMLWMLKADHEKPWRGYQDDAKTWEVAMNRDAAQNALNADQKAELAERKHELALLQAQKPDEELTQLQKDLDTQEREKATLDLPMRKDKGELTPLTQVYEKARLAYGEDSPQSKDAFKALQKKQSEYDQKFARMSEIDLAIEDLSQKIANKQSEIASNKKRIDDLERTTTTLQEKIDKLEPDTLGKKFTEKFRNAPLSDWFNPDQKVQQVVVPDVRTDLNFLTVETIDRCQTCHVNIDNPKFEESTLIGFVERQLAISGGQAVNELDQPLVMTGFWKRAIDVLGEQAQTKAKAAREKALTAINDLLSAQGGKAIDDAGLDAFVENSGQAALGAQPVPGSEPRLPENATDAQKAEHQKAHAEWESRNKALAAWNTARDQFRARQRQAVLYIEDLKRIVREEAGAEQSKEVRGLYRHALVDAYNVQRKKAGLSPVSASSVLLAHPRLDLYAEAESKHPMKTMGCTVCHEGSGQETQFEHTAHSPRDIWVDATTGAPVPAFLLKSDKHAPGNGKDDAKVADHGTATVTLASAKAGETHDNIAASQQDAHAGGNGSSGHGVSTHQDIKLTDPNNPAPFAPEGPHHDSEAIYTSIATDASGTRQAITQEEYWTRKYGWAEVHYMHWEKPMNTLDYIESSCSRCHSEVFDIRDDAPRLFEGRRLFAQLGCANCHLVEQIGHSLDLKKVGPSLAHLHDKLSPEMTASWIWSPRAFRPMTRMPHFFMLENNSSPIDILRTRTEVAAITYYLLNEPLGYETTLHDLQKKKQQLQAELSQPMDEGTRKLKLGDAAKLNDELKETAHLVALNTYNPEKPPATEGDVAKGRELFTSVGCMACHTNMAEQGETMIVEDLVKRSGLGVKEAKSKYTSMSYNQRHWYALEHLSEKLMLVGPELSGVGTKLKAGRTSEQARAWTYDWVRNPRHYSSYTIMPSFRLSEEEANDLTAYLLSLERPDYKPENFLALDDSGKTMLTELVAGLKSGQVTTAYARDILAGKVADPAVPNSTAHAWSDEEKLHFLGKKMITHYGCNSCHQINGLENATSPCAQLDDWGVKDPHKLDFGYFDHAFDQQREKPQPVWKVDHEGLGSDAPQISYHDTQGPEARIHLKELAWEHMQLERRPWLYNKLHNTRVYDRGRESLESRFSTVDAAVAAMKKGETDTVGKPYDKIKMPKFFLKDEEVRSLVTFVTSLRKPLVSDAIAKKTYSDAKMRVARGRQLATLYNCYGCHEIDGNVIHIQDLLPIHNADGTVDLTKMTDFAPPRLVGEGARTQPEWLHKFLLNVHLIRPWLKVRMPSFALHDTSVGLTATATSPGAKDHATYLVEYFGGDSEMLGARIAALTAPIEAYQRTNPNSDWFAEDSLAPAVKQLEHLALEARLAKPADFDERLSTLEDRRVKWKTLMYAFTFLRNTYQTSYPFPGGPPPSPTPDSFERGRQLFVALNCQLCHTLGDPDVLAKLAKLNAASAPPVPTEEEEDPYGDSGDSGGSKAADQGEEEDPYGDDSSSSEELTPYLKLSSPEVPTGLYAPNLIEVSQRLQYNWVYHWVQIPQFLMPGTRMLTFFPAIDPISGKFYAAGEPSSYFLTQPEEAKEKAHALFGSTGDEQIRLVLDFVYQAGRRNYTPGSEQLYGAPPKADEVLPPYKDVAPAQGPNREATPIIIPPQNEQVSAPELTPAQPKAETPAPSPATTPETKTPAAPPKEAATSSIELNEGSVPFKGTRVVGVISAEGRQPPRKRLIVTDAACAKIHGSVLTEDIIINPDKTLRNAVVYVKDGLPAGAKFEPVGSPEMDQVGCQYLPHVQVVMVNQPLLVKNGDNTLHNVHTKPKLNKEMNIPQTAGVSEKLKFTKAENSIPIGCDVHPWMNAWVHVFPHPFAAVTDMEGRYEIKGLPPGKYTLGVIHDDKRVAPTTIEVTVAADQSVRADATMTVK